MNLEIITLSKSQTKTDIIWQHLEVESKKDDASELFHKTEKLTDMKNKHGYQRGKEGA